MKLIVQIPCFNEAENLSDVIDSIPLQISGIDSIEILVIDDGSTDNTSDVAGQAGADYIITSTTNKGLARSFHIGIEECLRQGADIIVNIDGDNQYRSADIPLLVTPIINKEADITVGDRGGFNNPHFSLLKRSLQVFGSFVVRSILKLDITDAVSGFRAISREAARQINIVSEFSYTLEMLVQASAKRMSIKSVPIQTNQKLRESRLFKSIPQFLYLSVTTLIRMYTMYRPLRVFLSLGLIAILVGMLPIIRFVYFYAHGNGDGHMQSLILGSTLMTLGVITLLVGLIADLINFNRKLTEKMLHKMERMDERVIKVEQEVSSKSEVSSTFTKESKQSNKIVNQ
ncbi:glycosyltransferase family 2 protein [Shewanella schlegeliana]|uniref:Glycosyltransferase family 2 protein n=1 Tax=Shewanella schlegeliana TaxID=190308 RepID=A0ABS1T2T0_9GAMM|nr:glycosyltransferase family 2 protein [Shewanella schlegeliana]MBL4913821.1 glycosyltransferase family 2 protein [Shewanella schlegeliana]MCL1108794.1 glycosyltransferase family 2 protein [Shewanella schlegeliana]GIU25995.1 glycosyl transferase [Shewanella schlegeliana]